MSMIIYTKNEKVICTINLHNLITSHFIHSTFPQQVLPFIYFDGVHVPNMIHMHRCCYSRNILTNIHHQFIYHISLHHRTLKTCSLSNQRIQWFQVPLHHPHWPCVYRSTHFNLLNLVYELVLLCIEKSRG